MYNQGLFLDQLNIHSSFILTLLPLSHIDTSMLPKNKLNEPLLDFHLVYHFTYSSPHTQPQSVHGFPKTENLRLSMYYFPISFLDFTSSDPI